MAQAPLDTQRVERLGPAERVIQTVTSYIDHVFHGRTGIIVRDPTTPVGVKWTPASWKLEGKEGEPVVKVVYRLDKVGTKSVPVRIGVLGDDAKVRDGGRIVAEFRNAGLFPEVVAYCYEQIAAVWKADADFAARWASWSMTDDHRDLKVLLAAFMLVQNRHGAPVRDNGVTIMRDEDYRAVGEAMLLKIDKKAKRSKDAKDADKDRTDFNPRMLMRVGDVLALKEVAEINHRLGFNATTRRAALGRYGLAVEKWLRHRESNPKMLTGLVAAGFRNTVRDLARRIGYKPETPFFFQVLRWKQDQASDGRRKLAIGEAVADAETWAGLTETEICERIEKTKPNYKRIVGLIPPEIRLTTSIMAAAIEAGSLSENDMIQYAPTIEDLGLLAEPAIKARVEAAIANATARNRRAANIAARVTNEDVKAALLDHADNMLKKDLEEASRGLFILFIVDKSSSMQMGLDRAKACLAKCVQGFPPERIRVSVFNTQGSEVIIKHPSAAGVEQAFRGHAAEGGTTYSTGVSVLHKYIPKPEDDVDVLPIFVGDQEDTGGPQGQLRFVEALRRFNPPALGMLHIGHRNPSYLCVEKAAATLGIPCIPIDERIFDDAYSSVRTLRNVIASTPAGTVVQSAVTPPKRVALIDTIMATPLLERPVWAVRQRMGAV